MRKAAKPFFQLLRSCTIRWPLAAVLSLLLCLPTLSGCAWAAKDDSPDSLIAYDAGAMTYTVAGRTYTNLFEYAASPNGDYLIYIASQLNQDPAVWLYDRKADTHLQLTDNDHTLRSQAQVDDSGSWALTQGFYGRELICDSGVIGYGTSPFMKRSLCFWRGKLFYAVWDQDAGVTSLFLYDPETKETTPLASGLPVSTGLSAAAGDAVLLEAYDAGESANTVLAVYPEREGEELMQLLSGGDSFLTLFGGAPQVLQVSGDDNAKYYFNTCYWLNRYQSGDPWSGSPDSAGRVSWNESYRLMAQLELWEKTRNEDFRTAAASAVHRLISTREAAYQSSGRDMDRFLFVTKIYSLDGQSELRSMANNAMVYYPMLRAANLGCLEEEDRRTLFSMAEAAFQYYEEDWDSSVGCYRFRKGEPFYMDGSILPFNQQNTFGLCLIELWKATGKTVYRDRCTALAKAFAGELEMTEDRRTIWHYMPQKHYEGWTEVDGVSQNMPSLAPMENPPYEDTSHASHNAVFLLEYYRTFGDVFTPAQVLGVRWTLDAICTDEGISFLLEPLEPAYWYLNSRWAGVIPSGERGSAIARRFLSTDAFAYVEYDSQIPFLFARLYDPAEEGWLRVSTAGFADGALQPLSVMTVRAESLPALTVRLRMVPPF